ncbi:outer membrane protein assembly factor BamE [Pontiella sp.]|uniref:outer membrane protein assembly factor BamE domain-containing protein n=1 Tax=Pontiella sp. TaxID=2837462 RepID=UPI00356AA2FF
MKTLNMILAAVVLFLAGCATTFVPWKLSDVKEGMARDQVVKLLGEPDYTVDKDGAELLYYSYVEEPLPMSETSMDSHASMDQRAKSFSRTLTDVKYEVMLVDGKVINYKEL